MPTGLATDLAETVPVLLPLPLGARYTYGVPEGLAVAPGDFVTVPLGNRRIAGVVWDGEPGEVAPEKLKAIGARLDAAPLPEVSRRFVEWVAAYTLSSEGAVLKMAMSVPDALEPPKPVTAYALAANPPEFRATPARERVLAVLADGPPRPAAELAREAGVGTAVVRGLAKANVLAAVDLAPAPSFQTPDPGQPGPRLSPEQQAAADDLRGQVAAQKFSVTLLDGVPGAGKTEVYLEAAARALEAGKQVLVMLPEIALGAQWRDRFRARFGCLPAEWHSDLTQTRRRETWRAAATGEARVIVGARSALFLPFPDLGLIVIDEEHESAFKQEDGVVYNARDMAVVRAQLGKIPIVLASATPSLETVTNVAAGRYGRLHLPDRHGGAQLPEISAIDMRSDGPERGRWLSPELVGALSKTFEAEEQALLFLNRRGYAPLTLCRACGHRLQCPSCTAWLVEHRLLGRLQCHHCGYSAAAPSVCPECGATDSLYACGPGVERLAEEVAELFPAIRTAVATSDTVYGPNAAAELVHAIENREIDLVIGTQIVAKGYHFPHLTLVGVVDADLGLTGGDLRAAERTYQLLYQVAGRAGRGEKPGRVLVQTYMPEHPVMAALTSGDRDGFLAAESAARKSAGMPPFGRLVAVVVSGTDEADVDHAARALARAAPAGPDIKILGPAPAPLALLRGRHRRRLLLMASRQVNVQKTARQWLAALGASRRVRLHVDVDPYSFM